MKMSELLSEKDMGKHNNATTGFKALAKKAGGGEKGAKIAGAQFQKMKKAGQLEEQGMTEMHGRRDAYQRDYDSSVSGMGRKDSLAYQMDGGANDEGWDREERSYSADVPHDVHINGKKWKSFGSHSHASNVAKKIKGATVHKSLEETASAGATSSASIGTVDAPHISPGKARGKKSYTGSPSSGSGTKAPPQPKVVQPKNSNGTAKNGLDIKGTSLFGGPANEAAVIKRR